MVPETYARISRKRFLEDFWPIPSVDSPYYTPRARRYTSRSFANASKNMKTLRGKHTAEALAKLVHDYKLAPGFQLSISQHTATDDDSWGYLEGTRQGQWPQWARPRIYIRFCRHDPFEELDSLDADYGWHDEGHDDYREKVRTDITTRIEERFIVQILTAAYVFIVHDSTIRLSRWDRSGTVFSRRLDFAVDPYSLSEIFWRLSMLTEVQLGMDPTATPVLPGSEEYNLMERLSVPRVDDLPCEEGTTIEGDPNDPSRTFGYIRTVLDASLHKPRAHPFQAGVSPRWKLSVPLEDGSVREFLVGMPFSYPDPQQCWVDCRNGRVYVAIDCTTERLVFLKDAWRFTDVDEKQLSEREGLVLKHLNEAGVSHVPTLLCEAQLPGQMTKSPRYGSHPRGHGRRHGHDESSDYESDSGSDTDDDDDDDENTYCFDPRGKAIIGLHHYRMVVSEFCLQLRHAFKTGRQLVSIIRDCILAHSQAVEVLGRLHCDISYGNMMIYPKFEVSEETGEPTIRWTGMLIDWELNRRVNESCYLPPRMTNQRTWMFVSVRYLRDEEWTLTIPDELESFFYVLLHLAVRYLQSNVKDASRFDHKYFPEYRYDGLVGGKMQMMRRGYIMADEHTMLVFRALSDKGDVVRTPMDNLVKRLAWLLHAQVPGTHSGKMSVDPPGLRELSTCSVSEAKETSASDAVTGAPPKVQDEWIEAKNLAQKLKDHREVLRLFDDALRESWPAGDYVGDRLVQESSSSPDAKPPNAQDHVDAPKLEAAAEKVLEPKDLNPQRAAKAARKKPEVVRKKPKAVHNNSEGVDSRKRRRNPTRAARPSGLVPEERPAKRRRRA